MSTPEQAVFKRNTAFGTVPSYGRPTSLEFCVTTRRARILLARIQKARMGHYHPRPLSTALRECLTSGSTFSTLSEVTHSVEPLLIRMNRLDFLSLEISDHTQAERGSEAPLSQQQ